MFKHNFVGQVGLFLGISVLLSACAVGEIGDAPGGARLGPGDDFVGQIDPSEPVVPGIPAALNCAGAAPDLSTTNDWRSSDASLPAFDALYFEFKARPTGANIDGLVGVGAEDINDFAGAALTVRFAEDGLVDVRDGAVYKSDTSYAYDPGVWYTVAISANVATETYDVEIGPCGEPRETLIEGASFRQESDVNDQLSTWGVWSSQAAALEVSTPTWMASGGCAPATCQSLGSECGQPSDGCGGTLNCGGCASGQTCSSGVCVDQPVSVPPPPICTPATCQSLGNQCGVASNGCGGTLNCGGCSSGQLCSSGLCVNASVPPPPCVPDTCQSLGKQCGAASNGCGGTLNCGGCSSGQLCSSGLCVNASAPPPPPSGAPSDGDYAHVVTLTGSQTGSSVIGTINALGPGSVLVRPLNGSGATITGGMNIPRSDVTLYGLDLTGSFTFADGTVMWGVTASPGRFSSEEADNWKIRDSLWSGGAGLRPEQNCIGNVYAQNFIGGEYDPSDGWIIEDSTFENYVPTEGGCFVDHSEAFYIGAYSFNGVIRNNVFTNNGNTSAIFFTWWGGGCSSSDPTCYPDDICVEGNTYSGTWNFSDINCREELPASLNLYIDPAQGAGISGNCARVFERVCP